MAKGKQEDPFWESIGDVFEPHKLTQDEREDWTAAVMYLQRVGDSAIVSELPVGVVVLGGELHLAADRGNWVFWRPAKGGGAAVRLAKDWGAWRKRIVAALHEYGLGDPRTDEDVRTWTTVGVVAAGVVGAVLGVLTFGTAAVAVGAGASVASAAAYAAADASEEEWASAMSLADVEHAAITGSASDKAIGADISAAVAPVAGAMTGAAAAGGSAADVAAAGATAATTAAQPYVGDALDAAGNYITGGAIPAGTLSNAAAVATAGSPQAMAEVASRTVPGWVNMTASQKQAAAAAVVPGWSAMGTMDRAAALGYTPGKGSVQGRSPLAARIGEAVGAPVAVAVGGATSAAAAPESTLVKCGRKFGAAATLNVVASWCGRRGMTQSQAGTILAACTDKLRAAGVAV